MYNTAPRCPFNPGEVSEPLADPNVPVDTASDGYEPSVSENATDFKLLQSALDPLAKLAASRIHLIAVREPNVLRERAANVPTCQVPFAPEYAELPPEFFGNGVVAFPESVEAADLLLANFAAAHPGLGTREGWETSLGRSVKGRIANKELSLDTGAWTEYEALHAAHQAGDTDLDLFDLWLYRSRELSKNAGKFAPYQGRFDTFVYGKAATGAAAKMDVPSNLVMPVGAYGQAFADRLLRATIITIEQLASVVDIEASDVAAQYADVLARRTARGQAEENLQISLDDGPDKRDPITAATPKAILQEGALSVMQAVALLTADKIPGYEDPDVLLRDIIDQGLIEQVTRKLPMGYVGPLALKGVYHPNPLKIVDGELQLTATFQEHLRAERASFLARVLDHLALRHMVFQTAAEEDKEVFSEGQLGIMCPVAGQNGGLRKMAAAMGSIYECLA
jgi:hypothetical protein